MMRRQRVDHALNAGDNGALMLRPEQIRIRAQPSAEAAEGGLQVVVRDVTYLGDTMHYAWDFDSRDGSTQVQATGKVVSWTYNVGCEYNVTLTVTDTQGQSTDVLRVFVRDGSGGVPGIGNLPPIVIISSPFPGERFDVNQPIHFNGSRSFDPEGGALICEWHIAVAGTLLSSACDMTYAFADSGLAFPRGNPPDFRPYLSPGPPELPR